MNPFCSPQAWSVRLFALLLFIFVAVSGAAAQTNASNFITIREKAGVTTSQYPIQIARPFMQGEIRNFPKAVVNGVQVTTQADVKTRWADGSVKHAVLTFHIPTLTANSTVTVQFVNQTSGNNTGFLTKTQMLANTYNFDARTELTNGATVAASARTMLNADKFEYWNRGAVSTSVVIADHSAARAYDVGFDANKSFRPIFHATFWPAIKKVRVRFIGEVANTVALQDQVYALALRLQNTSRRTVYTKGQFTHSAGARWTKEFWIGGAPPLIEINHNLAYLKQTKALPNYDTSKIISETALERAYSDPVYGWTPTAKDLFDPGNLTRYMPTPGGRDELGPYPTWTVRWLYTGDRRMTEQTFGNGDLSAAFPVHFREGLSGRLFDRNGVAALGKPVSITARPTLLLGRGNDFINYAYTDQQDKIVPVGPMTSGGWLPDCAHQPDYVSPLYTLTGDFFYLEEVYFWATWSSVSTISTPVYYYGRGPTGDTGGIYDEVRGDAWQIRNRAQTAYLAPDGSPEETYFTRLTNDALGIWEGVLNLTGGQFQGTANWNWGNTVGVLRFGPHGAPTVPQLGFWEEGNLVPSWSTWVDPTDAVYQTPAWMHYYLVYSLGRVKELGFASNGVLSWVSKVVIGQLNNAAVYDPNLISSYQMPTVKRADNTYFGQWLDEDGAFLDSYNPLTDFNNQLLDADHGYVIVSIPAVAMAAGETGGANAWAFIQQRVLPAPAINDNPKWAILPR